jgi:hypothetical protein
MGQGIWLSKLLPSRQNRDLDFVEPRGTLYRQTLALTSPTSGGRSVGMVRLQTQATEVKSIMDRYGRNSAHNYENRALDALDRSGRTFLCFLECGL